VALRGYNVYKLLWSTDGRWLAVAVDGLCL
jgi:hypothetical protein